MEGELWKAVLRLIFFLPLVLLLAYWSIKIGATRGPWTKGSSQMRLVERIALSPKTGLCVVKIGSSYYLIGTSEQSVKLLKELPDYEEDPQGAEASSLQKPQSLWKIFSRSRTKE